MLVIREAQIVALSRALRSRFEREALGHVKACFPEQCVELGEENAFHYVQQGLRRAKDYGFESQYDLLRFLNVMFTLGADFDQSELHAWMRPILMGRDMAPSTRMDSLLHELHLRLVPATNLTAPSLPTNRPESRKPTVRVSSMGSSGKMTGIQTMFHNPSLQRYCLTNVVPLPAA